MNKFLTSLLCASSFLASASLASAEPEKSTAQQTPPVQEELKLLELVQPGEVVEPGDLVKVERPFDTWSLYCDTRLSTNKRICSIQEYIVDGGGFLFWSLKPTNKGSALVFVLPSTLDKASGLRIDFGLEKTIPSEDWVCTDRCIAVVPFEGLLQNAILRAETVKFSYTIKREDKSHAVALIGNMQGFTKAVHAASNDPFGKAAQLEQVKKADTKKEAQPLKKPVQQSAKAKPPKTQTVTKTDSSSSQNPGLY